ncbi:MAG: hypothetical protein AB2L14_09760 [Candidatus Xenobiia bacterium LiM19]
MGSATRDTLFALDAKTGKQLWQLNGECV